MIDAVDLVLILIAVVAFSGAAILSAYQVISAAERRAEDER